jgi:hypothetical protein
MEKYIDLIAALRAKAADAASTEAEVAEAAAAASRLMAKHGIEESDIERANQDNTFHGMKHAGAPQPSRQVQHAVMAALWGIEIFTETECWLNTYSKYAGNGKYHKFQDAVFCGFEGDIEMAFYLTELVRGAGDRAWKAFLAEHSYMKEWEQYPRKQKMEAFKTGFGQRVGSRLVIMAEERQAAAPTPTGGTSLVIQKQSLIERYMEEHGVVLRKSRKRGRTLDAAALIAGSLAGNSLNLNRPVGQGTNAERLA